MKVFVCLVAFLAVAQAGFLGKFSSGGFGGYNGGYNGGYIGGYTGGYSAPSVKVIRVISPVSTHVPAPVVSHVSAPVVHSVYGHGYGGSYLGDAAYNSGYHGSYAPSYSAGYSGFVGNSYDAGYGVSHPKYVKVISVSPSYTNGW